MTSTKKLWIAVVGGVVVLVLLLVGVKAGQIVTMVRAGESFAPPPESVSAAKVEQVEAKRKQVEARIAQADAALSGANIMLGFTVIHSPISGVVTSKTANTGEMTTPGRPLLKVVDDGELRLLANIKESDMLGMVKGDTVKVGFDALSGREVQGRIGEVIPAAAEPDPEREREEQDHDRDGQPLRLRDGRGRRSTRPLDRVRSLFVPMKRYHCPKCGWTGLQRSAGHSKGDHNT